MRTLYDELRENTLMRDVARFAVRMGSPKHLPGLWRALTHNRKFRHGGRWHKKQPAHRPAQFYALARLARRAR